MLASLIDECNLHVGVRCLGVSVRCLGVNVLTGSAALRETDSLAPTLTQCRLTFVQVFQKKSAVLDLDHTWVYNDEFCSLSNTLIMQSSVINAAHFSLKMF